MATNTAFLKLYKPVTNELGWDDNMNSNLDIVDGFVKQFMNIPGFVGAWTNSVLYTVGQIALDVNTAQFFRCAVQNTSAATGTFAQDRTARPTLWTLTTSPAADSATAAAASASAAANSANVAAGQFNSFRGIYYGPFATPPINDPLGNARTTGDLYFDTTTLAMNVWSGTAWIPITAAFNDAPTTPAGAVFVRTAAHTWAVGVGQAGGDFTGDVIFHGRVAITNTQPPQSVWQPGVFFADQIATIGGIGQNLIFTGVKAGNTSGWSYVTPPVAGGEGALALVSVVSTVPLHGADVGVRQTVFFSTVSGETGTAGGQANLAKMAEMRSSGEFLILDNAFKPNGGVWAALTSDVRTKNVIGPYPHGLAELLEMLPKLFTYKSTVNEVAPDGSMGAQMYRDTTKQYIGLIAQDCEPYMPELVTQTSAYIDGVLQTDVRQLDATGVIYALVNAVATLDARLKTLEAAR